MGIIIVASQAYAQLMPSEQCHLINNADQFNEYNVKSQFAPPYNVISQSQEAIIKIYCRAPNQFTRPDPMVSVVVGSVNIGSQNLYIFNQGYQYADGRWQPVALSQSTLQDPWYRSIATSEWPLPQNMVGQTGYYISYLCFWDESRWKCGCQTQACTEAPQWSLQAYTFPNS